MFFFRDFHLFILPLRELLARKIKFFFNLYCRHARFDCLKLYLEKLQWDVNLPSKVHGWLPVQIVLNHLNDERTIPCLKYLISKGANINGYSILLCSIKICHLVLYSVNSDGSAALHQAAAEGDTESVKILLEKGANPFIEDIRGCTPLQLAKIWGHREAARAIENAIWKLNKGEASKENRALLRKKKSEAIGDIKTAVNRISQNQDSDKSSTFDNWMRNQGLDDHSIKVLS